MRYHRRSFASKVRKPNLDTVSTTCDSGWVDDQHAILLNDFECRGLTHPLSQVVLTVSNSDLGLLRQSFSDATGLAQWHLIEGDDNVHTTHHGDNNFQQLSCQPIADD
jgi:hypothetical protein